MLASLSQDAPMVNSCLWTNGIPGWTEVFSVPPLFLLDSSHSCGFLWNSCGILVEFTSQNFTPATKLCNSGIYTGMVPGVRSPEWHWNPVSGIEIKHCWETQPELLFVGKLSQKGRCIHIRVNDTDRQHEITDTPQKSVYISILVFTTVCTHVFATRFQFYFNFSLQSCGIHWNPVPFRWISLDSTGFRQIPPEWLDSDRNRGGHCKVLAGQSTNIEALVSSLRYGLIRSCMPHCRMYPSSPCCHILPNKYNWP